ncbi:MAG TPA: TrbG/VirB9 family P-type conjugative transfer protein [Alloacidobacterium sp.]|nr:TrbG/VirB9 family P-type conjugative transfer protein [Alloacidobacterium sp.]
MKVLTIATIVLATVAAGAQTTTQTQIRHIETSLNHLTVLEFGESVTTLAVADPDTFQIERHGDKVFIKPLREGVSTNLFVWTTTRELSYELDPAGQLAQMDVMVRAEPAPGSLVSTQASAEPSDAEIRKIASLVLTQAMLGVEDIVHDPEKRATGRVQVDLEQVYRAKDRIYIRYSVANQTRDSFRVTAPEVYAGVPSVQPIALLSLKNHQITSHTFGKFKTTQSSVVGVQADSAARDLAPGEKATGVISIGTSAGIQPQIYQLTFGSDRSGPLKVEVVL